MPAHISRSRWTPQYLLPKLPTLASPAPKDVAQRVPTTTVRSARGPAPSAPRFAGASQVPQPSSAPPSLGLQAEASRAIATMIEGTEAQRAAATAYIVHNFTAPYVQKALQTLDVSAEQRAHLLWVLQRAFCQSLSGTGEPLDEAICDALAVYLLEQCPWEQICNPEVFDAVHMTLGSGTVVAAFLAAEGRDAAAARANAAEAFASAEDPQALVENLILARRITIWDSYLQVQSYNIVASAIADGDFTRIENLLQFAPPGSDNHVLQLLFDQTGPADGDFLTDLQAFCRKNHFTLPATLLPEPQPVTLQYVQALLQGALRRGLAAHDISHFWGVLKRCDPEVRERLVRSDLDGGAQSELGQVLGVSPVDQVLGIFPESFLATLMVQYRDHFDYPLLAFGTEFASRILDTLPAEQSDTLIAAHDFGAVRELMTHGLWPLLGKITNVASDASRTAILAILTAPPPPRDDSFGTQELAEDGSSEEDKEQEEQRPY